MLTKDEKQRLSAVIASVTRDIDSLGKYALAAEYTLDTVHWIAVALKKSDDALRDLTAKHQELDKMLAEAHMKMDQLETSRGIREMNP